MTEHDRKLLRNWKVSRKILESWVLRDYGLRMRELRVVVELQFGTMPAIGSAQRAMYFARIRVALPGFARGRQFKKAQLHADAVMAHMWAEEEFKR